MNRHSEIRKAIIARLKEEAGNEVTYFDGRPGFIDEDDLPAVAVYLTDAQYTAENIDGDPWVATLHIEVFLKAAQPDSALDLWMENKIYPALNDIPALAGLINTMVQQGYDYQRDTEMVTWGSADLTYTITYAM